ncbi:C2 domain-containing protein 2 isoform X2 [Scyliorhinus canicula]|uniref:C2 domain-containing protein 2 isoform X2 n=1 Tax=Scyliorhinus canicula TaxID=7830 RepID=UPI0018F494D2|nr:C2 domain-containing protein 2 isoform X2 [Scyliorhinus canicula]
MSDSAVGTEPSLFDVLMWVGLLAIFLVSVLTLALYGLQRLLRPPWGKVKAGSQARAPAAGSPPSDPSEGAAALLSWLLSLESWNREWQKAWVTALNAEAAKNGSSLQLSVDKVGPHSSPFDLSHITTVIQSDRHLLEIHIQDIDVVQVTWSLVDPQNLRLKVTPRITREVDEEDTYRETIYTLLQDMLTSARPRVLLSMKAAPLKESQNLSVPQTAPSAELNSQVCSPPKPPRAHERKLLVKIIKVDNLADPDAAERVHPYCVVELDNPVQKATSSVMSSISNPLWDQQFVFELSAKSKKLHMQILEDGRPSESAVLGAVTVPIDLFKKQPSGRQSFRLANTQNGNSSGSITAEFCYMEPNEAKCRQSPSLLSAKKVEKDRTVMPCGTVVTTVTAVKTKPRTDGKLCGSPTDSPVKNTTEVKDADEEFLTVGHSEQGAPVSKILSSSDTELLQLSGTDPVAEAAIRQLTESAKHALKSPIRKSTIVISGVTKAPMAVDDEMTLSADYAAAMDASLCPEPHPSSECMAGRPAEQTLTYSLPMAELCPTEGSSATAPTSRVGQEFGQWNDGSREDLDFEQRSNISIGGSEAGTMKKSRGGLCGVAQNSFSGGGDIRRNPG